MLVAEYNLIQPHHAHDSGTLNIMQAFYSRFGHLNLMPFTKVISVVFIVIYV
jgi:hypothetical protein